ncbi:MAG TPA: LysM peptidoglycan-binding domain-containing protein [Anaerolineales bacterium]|nr:LysM peptidoglycan-binding domain-containing protein [Anaerolineales bacterium]
MKTHPPLLMIGFILLAWTLPFQPPPAGPSGLPQFQEEASPTPMPAAPSPADVINAVNDLRLANGLNALSVHPVLMDVAAQQANALAASGGMIGHERPCGMTLGQQLLLMGFPLWGDLSQDGYRSENWAIAFTVEEVISSWLGDFLHTNTMLSEFRSDIGAAVAISDQTYIVLETALRTNTGQHQSPAYPILTSIPVTQAACMGMLTPNADGSISQYSIPVTVSTARPDGDVVHEVRYGQTLWSLAIQYKVRIEDIKRVNGLTNDTIAPGWKLLIQKAATQPAPLTPNSVLNSSIQSQTPFVIPTWTPIPSATPLPNEAGVLVVSLGQNKIVLSALIISFSVLVAGIVGFGKKKDE